MGADADPGPPIRADVGLDEDDRELLLAAAAMAAGAFANALHVERLEREAERLRGAELGHRLITSLELRAELEK